MDINYFRSRQKLIELRYNPYHDPSNGRFTSGGGGGGGMLVVPKGQKGKGFYVAPDGPDKGEAALAGGEYEKWQKESAVFKPSVTDAVSEKIGSADYIRVSARTITIKDENDKTRGVLRDVERYNNMREADKIRVDSVIRKAGGSGVISAEDLHKNIFRHKGKIYFLNSTEGQKIMGMFNDRDREKNRKKNETLKRFEDAGIVVANYGKHAGSLD